MTLRWTDEQLEAHRKRMGGAKGSEVKVVPMPAPKYGDPGTGETSPPPKSKYRAIRVGKHASKKESRRAQELHLMQLAGTIHNLREQVRYELIPAQYIDGKCVERSVVYVADFSYLDSNGCECTEDCKGFRTPVYILKRKMLLFLKGVRIKET